MPVQTGRVVVPNTEKIKCLSIRQPYADDVFFGGKWAENRSQRTHYTGELWIHASSRDDVEGMNDADSPTRFATGFILGRVNVVGCVSREELMSVAPRRVLDDFGETNPAIDNENVNFCRKLLSKIGVETWRHVANSKFVWLFAEPEMLENPIRIGGKLGFWHHTVTEDRLLLADGRRKKWKLT